MTKILIVGASHGTGLEAVNCALAKGYEVRALARHPENSSQDHSRLERVAGDARDRAVLASAITGVDAVIVTLGATADPRVLIFGTTLFSDATRPLIDAMKAANVKRLIVLTGLGAGDSRGHGGFLYDAILFPLLLKRVYDDKDVQEQMVRGSGLDWTIVRPGLLTSGPSTGNYHVLEDPTTWRAGTISRADVADFLIRQVTDHRYVGKTPVVIG
jgi:putative NADH-flavin reductase